MSSSIGEICYKNNQRDGSMTETGVLEKGAKIQTANGEYLNHFSYANWIVYSLF